MMHETVTLQFGNRANYLATHFWNIQESYFTFPTTTDPSPEVSAVDHDIHFRPGIGADGSDTYTPRTLIYDYQTNFGGLRKINGLYEILQPGEVIRGLWDGAQQTQLVPPVQPIPYQTNLESGLPTTQIHNQDVRYWSDFNRLFFHPRSILPLSPQGISSSLYSSDSWESGVDLYKQIDNEVDLLDRDVRAFAEECDSLATFQIFCSADDIWGGYATSYTEALKEEYGKKTILVWAIEDSRRVERAKQYQRLTNSTKSLRHIVQHASAYIRLANVPSSLPDYVHLQTESEWSTSALMCAALETVTLPSRLRSASQENTTNTSIDTFENVLNTNGNQNVWTLKARVHKYDRNGDRKVNSEPNGRGNFTAIDGTAAASAASDPRIPRTTNNNIDVSDTQFDPSLFDISFTPAAPPAQRTFPSLTSEERLLEDHIFAQVESHRHQSTFRPRQRAFDNHDLQQLRLRQSRYGSEPLVQIYDPPVLFPVLDSYPDTLFDLSSLGIGGKEIAVDAGLATSTSTRRDVLMLRDLITSTTGRRHGLIDTDEQEGMYDDLTRLAEGYTFGFEGSDYDDENEDE